MTSRRYVDIWCEGPGMDGEGCLSWAEGATSATAARARKNVRCMGWTRKNGKDLCPVCSSERGSFVESQFGPPVRETP